MTIASPLASPAVPGYPGTAAGKYTVANLIALVNKAVCARKGKTGMQKRSPRSTIRMGSSRKNGLHVFAEGYNGTALAEPFGRDMAGTTIPVLKDSYGVPLIKNMGETAMGVINYPLLFFFRGKSRCRHTEKFRRSVPG